MHKVVGVFLSLVASSVFAQTNRIDTSSAEYQRAIEASKQRRGETTFWRADDIGVSLGYDERWREVSPSQSQTRMVIEWQARSSQGLMATCFVQAGDTSGIAKLSPVQIQQGASRIADSILSVDRMRDPNARMVRWSLATQDGHPVVYTERDVSVQNLERRLEMRIYTIATAWRGSEIQVSCASEVPRKIPEAAQMVEFPMKAVLGSVTFRRLPPG